MPQASLKNYSRVRMTGAGEGTKHDLFITFNLIIIGLLCKRFWLPTAVK
jgi:hypothetical protein